MSPPRDVRVVGHDGREYPVQTMFTHYDEQGIAVWEVVDAPPGVRIKEIRIGTLPPRTGVRLRP